MVAACSTKKAQAPTRTPTPRPTATPTPTPQQRLSTAAEHVQALKSFHFVLTHENGASPIALGLEMTKAEGDVENPDRLRATVDAKFQSIPVTVKVINVGSQTWITNPIGGGNSYQPLPGGTQAAAIFDPKTGVLKAMRDAKNPELTGSDTVDGVDTWVVQGTVDAGDLSSLATDAQAGDLVTAKVWIGKADSLIYKIRLEGPLSNSEPKNIVRQIVLSQFNEPINIQPPS